jgi:hypothetical protein
MQSVKRRQEELLKEQPQQKQGMKKNEALLKEGLVSIIGAFIVLFYLFSYCIYFLYFLSFALHLSFFDNHRTKIAMKNCCHNQQC